MAAFLITLVLLFMAWVLHVIWWRVRLPQNHTRALIAIFGATPLIAAAGWWMAGRPTWVDPLAWPGMALFYGAASACYLITYAGVEECSPSLAIFSALEQAEPCGCTKAELALHITESRFVRPRLDALHRDGLLEIAPAGARLTTRGMRVAAGVQRLGQIFNIRTGA